jgi:diacylglycerol kinase (ATP)
MSDKTKRILFVINTASGRKNTDWEGLIAGHFGRTGHETAYFMMPVADCLKKLREKVRNFLPELLVAVGGDGTVTLVAKEAMAAGLPMAIVPAGSANGMAKELEIPDDPDEALKLVLDGEIKATDVIRINDDEICLHLADIGLNARLVKYFQEGSIRGLTGYALALLKALSKRRRMSVHIRTRDSEIIRSAVMVLVANASRYGTGASINPEGSIYDGVFEVVVVRRLNLFQVLKMFLRMRRFNPRKIEIFQASSVRIVTSVRTHFQVDGEYLGRINELEARCAPGALQLVVPRRKEST